MIDIDKFPKAYKKSKAAYEKKWCFQMDGLEKIHDRCISDVDLIEERENVKYSTRCVDMMYKMFCRIFTEAEQSWFFTLFTIRERKIDEMFKTYRKLKDAFTEEELLEELRTHALYIAERKKILDEEIPLTQKAGIDYERFQKKVMWFLTLLDKSMDLDEGFFQPSPWLEGWDFDRVIVFQSLAPGFD